VLGSPYSALRCCWQPRSCGTISAAGQHSQHRRCGCAGAAIQKRAWRSTATSTAPPGSMRTRPGAAVGRWWLGQRAGRSTALGASQAGRGGAGGARRESCPRLTARHQASSRPRTVAQLSVRFSTAQVRDPEPQRARSPLLLPLPSSWLANCAQLLRLPAPCQLALLLPLPGVSGYVRKRKEELGLPTDTDDNTCRSDSDSCGDGSVDAGASPPREPEEGPALATECNGDSGTLDDGVPTSARLSQARAARETQRGERAAATVKLWHSCQQGDTGAAAAALAEGADVATADEVFASAARCVHLASACAFAWLTALRRPPLLPLCQEERLTAMHYAAASGSVACIRLLIKHGAPVRPRDRRCVLCVCVALCS